MEKLHWRGGKGWKLRNMTFESAVMAENWRSAGIVPFYKGKRERIECKNYKATTLLSIVEKIYVRVLVDKV